MSSGSILGTGRGTVWLGWGFSNPGTVPSCAGLSLYVPDFFLTSEKPWMLFSQWGELPLAELRAILQRTDGVVVETEDGEISWENPGFKAFRKVFEDLQTQIAAGELKKGVPVVFRTACVIPGSGFVSHVLRKLCEVAETLPLHVYGFWQVGAEGMLGATPEILFRQTEASTLETMALAGTRSHDRDALPLLEDAKESIEHRWVIDGIVAALSTWGTVRMGETRELRLRHLSHLVTPIFLAFDAPPPGMETLARILHPTPALGAWPREAGLRWLRDQPEAAWRRRFGAPFGMQWPDSGECLCVVSIRNVQWFSPVSGSDWINLRMGAGCGIIAESQLDREWHELYAKLDCIRQIVGL
ncbi:MAG: chorismate-binding protein [Pseudomonadota bacterium]